MTITADGVLMIHAFPLDATMWDEQVEWLRVDGWRVAAPSLPGFGETPGVGPVMSMGAAADRCLQALDAEGIERAVVCGLSMGGYVSFELWRLARQRIAGLVLANTRSEADTIEAAEARRALADRLSEEGSGFLVDDPPPLLAAPRDGGRWRFVRTTIDAQPAEAIAAAARGMAERPDSTPDLGTIDVPVLVLTSDADAIILAEVSLGMTRHIQGARSVTLAGAGHLSNLEAPDAFRDVVAGFLADPEGV
jgi:pimeloyl-ACP methyl ester carboxylesterase